MSERLQITHFTDPTCPYALSAEPLLRRLEWQLGDRAEWRIRMVGLTKRPEDALAKGFDAEYFTTAYARFGDEYGMPIDRAPRTRTVASVPVCRAIAATAFVDPARIPAMTRAARVRHFAGELIDEPATIRGCAVDAGLDPDEIERLAATRMAADALADDMDAARRPSPEALAQPDRLAPWSGGLRYTCPSLEVTRGSDGARLAAPGFQRWETYELVLANLAPDLSRRAAPDDVEAVLDWAPFPLATVEIAAICERDVDEVRAELERVATMTPVGPDGYWRRSGS